MNLQENINRIQEVMGIINEDSNTKELIFDMINDDVEGADLYEHNGDIWLMFTDEKRWVIELESDGTLWYNYNFFQNIFKYMSLDVVENQHYITEWVEDTIKNEVRSTIRYKNQRNLEVEDTIKNGVRSTDSRNAFIPWLVDDTFKMGQN